MIENTPTDALSEQKKTENQSITLMNWSIKTVDQPPNTRMAAIAASLSVPFALSIAALWAFYDDAKEDYEIHTGFIPAALIIGFLFLLISRQKTVFNYRIYPDHGEHEHYLYYPEYAGKLFTGIVIACILILAGVAIYTSSWLILIFGPIVILMGSGGSLLNFEQPEPLLVPSLPWKDHLAVTVDRKYRIVVTHLDDPTLGFVARFPDKQLMEQYLNFLRTTLPPTVQYKEDIWKW